MLSLQIPNKKQFMSLLLKSDTFDPFQTRQIQLKTFTTFEISSILEQDYFTLEEQESLEKGYCNWTRLKPIVFELIKGNKQPKLMHIIFSLAHQQREQLFPDAGALFINITFENGEITLFTGCSLKTFSLDKSTELGWDETVLSFLQEKGISYIEQ